MERVAFLIEQTGDRIACLLNPENIVVRRWAGIRPLRAAGAGSGVIDAPLLHTGGGTTELVLDLLFDVSLADGPTPVEDVRNLTRPLWRLSETTNDSTMNDARFVRLVWGKTWNVRAVVAALAERLESFDHDGAPGRSWLRMRLLRVDDDVAEQPSPLLLAGSPDETQVHEIPTLGPDHGDEPQSVTRMDELAYRYYGDPSLWKEIARVNGIDDPLRVPAGTLLRMPPRDEVETA